MDPPEKTIRDLIFNNYNGSDPVKADIEIPEIMRLEDFEKSRNPKKNYIWVTLGEGPLRPAAFTVKRVDQVCVVHVYTKASSSSKKDVLAANARKQSMLDEVCHIIIVHGAALTDFLPHLKLFVDRSDIYFDPPVFAVDVHVACTYLR